MKRSLALFLILLPLMLVVSCQSLRAKESLGLEDDEVSQGEDSTFSGISMNSSERMHVSKTDQKYRDFHIWFDQADSEDVSDRFDLMFSDTDPHFVSDEQIYGEAGVVLPKVRSGKRHAASESPAHENE